MRLLKGWLGIGCVWGGGGLVGGGGGEVNVGRLSGAKIQKNCVMAIIFNQI